ncbi:MAG: cobalamin B12-binding domain-containing protein, partial [Candidatus Omnitrophota bacterium]|nr:cobalamin B12-binding domain-containing protein [Candidatus Omnitrophota bacterium]
MVKNKIVLISTFPDIQSYGIRMLSSVLKKGGFKTNLIFLNAPFGSLYNDNILEEAAGIAQDSLFVGISLMTNFFDRTKQLTTFLKKRLNIPVVWGGIHTAVKPEECLKYADMICIGESEEVILPLAESIALSKEPEGIDNVWFCVNGKVSRNRIRPFVDKIDALPFPDCEYTDHFV